MTARHRIACMGQTSAGHPDVAAALAESRTAILDFLTVLVDCNSYVHRPEGVRQVAATIREHMPARFRHEVIRGELYADHHQYSHVTGEGLPVALVGHMDTLCPPDSSFDRLTVDGDKLLGPGVCDMKGGLTVVVWALKLLERCGLLEDLPLVCTFNGDEEVGSPTSRSLFTAMQGRASHALVFEPGGPGGTVVTTRKGISRYRLDISGRAAHFGCLRGAKASAVQELAHMELAVEAMNAEDGSLVANVGKVEGGLAANAVAARASMDLEVRYWDPGVGEQAAGAIDEMSRAVTVPGCSSELSRLSYRPPLDPSEGSRALFELARQVGKSLGQTLLEEKRGGVSDANWLSHVGIPTLDGLGPIGDLDFTDEEYVVTETVFDRVELTANLLLALGASSEG